jgi:hypothetical protein
MAQEEESDNGRHLLALGLVALIGLTGLVLMFKETAGTGQAVAHNPMVGCNADEILLSARGVAALKQRGRAVHGEDFSPYTAASINYNGVGYCANAAVVRELLG